MMKMTRGNIRVRVEKSSVLILLRAVEGLIKIQEKLDQHRNPLKGTPFFFFFFFFFSFFLFLSVAM